MVIMDAVLSSDYGTIDVAPHLVTMVTIDVAPHLVTMVTMDTVASGNYGHYGSCAIW